jgi:hypothetical protein
MKPRYPPGTYPVYQARLDRSSRDGDEIFTLAGSHVRTYAEYPSGHALRGQYDDGEIDLLSLLRERLESPQPRFPIFHDLGLGGDGHGTIKRYVVT